MSLRGRLGMDPNQFRITRAAMVLALVELGLSLVWLLATAEVREDLSSWLTATPLNVFGEYRVWTLVTTSFLEQSFLGLLLHMVVLWSFIPQLERFWGTPRFLRFAAITLVVGNLAGVALGQLVTHRYAVPLMGLNPLIDASFVAFGIVFARQHVMFMTRWPLTGRQMMYGVLGFLALSIVLQGLWEEGASTVAAGGVAAIMTSKWSPLLAWRRRKVARARAKLSVLQGGAMPVRGASKRRDENRFLN